MLELRPRLKKAADMVLSGVPVVDVGTDHAYLPTYLVLNNTVPYAIAGDIGEKPLKNAEQTVLRYGVSDRITLSVSDGLKNLVLPDNANITVCGMGGTLIADILDEGSYKILNGMHLVLQPMTHSEDVRRMLCKNGFTITTEECVLDGDRIYCCIAADKTDEKIDRPGGYYYFGELKKENKEECAFIDAQIKRIKKRLNAITQADLYPEEREMLSCVVSYYESRYGL